MAAVKFLCPSSCLASIAYLGYGHVRAANCAGRQKGGCMCVSLVMVDDSGGCREAASYWSRDQLLRLLYKRSPTCITTTRKKIPEREDVLEREKKKIEVNCRVERVLRRIVAFLRCRRIVTPLPRRKERRVFTINTY